MKRISIFLFIIASLFAMSSCEERNIANLKVELIEINRACQIELGLFGKLKSVSLEKNDTNVIFNITVNDKIVESILRKENRKDLINQYLNLMIYSDFSDLLDAIIGANASMKFYINLINYDETVRFDIPSDLLCSRLDHKFTENEKERLLVENKVSIENANCPVKVDYGVKRTKVAIVDEYLVYYFEINEDLYDIETIKPKLDELKADIINNIMPREQSDFQRLNRLGLGFIYRYYENKSKDYVDVVFTADELSTYCTYKH